MGYTLIAIVCIAYMVFFFSTMAKADGTYIEQAEYEQPTYFEVEATAYCDGVVCSTGVAPRMGICAGKPEWYGNVIALYENNNGLPGEFIGYFECLDTGGQPIREGKVIDIYNPSREWCLNFGRKNCIAIIIEGKG